MDRKVCASVVNTAAMDEAMIDLMVVPCSHNATSLKQHLPWKAEKESNGKNKQTKPPDIFFRLHTER